MRIYVELPPAIKAVHDIPLRIILTAPVGYVNLVYGFSRRDWQSTHRTAAAAHISDRFKTVIAKFPFLGGQLLLTDGS